MSESVKEDDETPASMSMPILVDEFSLSSGRTTPGTGAGAGGGGVKEEDDDLAAFFWVDPKEVSGQAKKRPEEEEDNFGLNHLDPCSPSEVSSASSVLERALASIQVDLPLDEDGNPGLDWFPETSEDFSSVTSSAFPQDLSSEDPPSSGCTWDEESYYSQATSDPQLNHAIKSLMDGGEGIGDDLGSGGDIGATEIPEESSLSPAPCHSPDLIPEDPEDMEAGGGFSASRPKLTLFELIAEAIGLSPQGMLTMNEICHTIARRHPFFRMDQKGEQRQKCLAIY